MRIYENAWPNKYEEIKTWYPVWYRDVLEMDALWRVWGKQLDDAQAGVIQAVDNNFIDYADAETIGKLEAFLWIVHETPRTLTERRNIIKAFLLGLGHIGQKEIKEILSILTPGEITVKLIGGTIQITIRKDSEEPFNCRDWYLILSNRIPTHLGLWTYSIIVTEYSGFACTAALTTELIREYYMDDEPGPETETFAYGGAATYHMIKEAYEE